MIGQFGLVALRVTSVWSSHVRFSAYVSPACLPSSALNNYDNVQAEVTGWGKLSYGGTTPSKLQKVKKIPTLRRLGSGRGVSRNNTTLRHTHVVCTRIIAENAEMLKTQH